MEESWGNSYYPEEDMPTPPILRYVYTTPSDVDDTPMNGYMQGRASRETENISQERETEVIVIIVNGI